MCRKSLTKEGERKGNQTRGLCMRSLWRETWHVVTYLAAVFFLLINVLNNSHFLFFNSWSSGKMNMTERLCPKATGKIRLI